MVSLLYAEMYAVLCSTPFPDDPFITFIVICLPELFSIVSLAWASVPKEICKSKQKKTQNFKYDFKLNNLILLGGFKVIAY